MKSSGNNNDNVILCRRHASISSLLQCPGRLSQPIAYWRDSRPRHCSRADILAWRPSKFTLLYKYLMYFLLTLDEYDNSSRQLIRSSFQVMAFCPFDIMPLYYLNHHWLTIWSLWSHFNEIWIKIQMFSFKDMVVKMSSCDLQIDGHSQRSICVCTQPTRDGVTV